MIMNNLLLCPCQNILWSYSKQKTPFANSIKKDPRSLPEIIYSQVSNVLEFSDLSESLAMHLHTQKNCKKGKPK